ncbi:MAG TPA: hypothetical protein VMR18_00480 [Candidatus Saccharimonadales bacterium]|nr:hypothetical protein [Candidatus Saccharimonadales bacterium]
MTSVAHDKFIELLRFIEPTQETVNKMKAVIKEQSVKELTNLNQEVADVRVKLSNLTDIRANAIKQFISGKISEDDEKEVLDNIDTERLDLKQQLSGLEQEQTLSEAGIDYALNFMTNVAKQWLDADLELKQKIQNVIFPQGFILDIKQGNFISPQLSPLYSLISSDNTLLQANNSVLVTPLHSNWKVICSEILRWCEVLNSIQWLITISHSANRA